MDFMRNLSREDCRFLDSLPQAERDAFNEMVIAEQERRAKLLTVAEVGTALSLARDSVSGLPLKWIYPHRKTDRGMRRVKSLASGDLIAFLSNLNPTFADFDAWTEKLLRPSEAMPDWQSLKLNKRVLRYRRPVNNIADKIMGA